MPRRPPRFHQLDARHDRIGAVVVCSFLGSGAGAGTPVSEAAGGALSSDATAVAPGGAAFSIWTLIYLGLIGLAVWQALPGHRANARQRQAGRWIAASMLLNATWIRSVQFDLMGVSVVVIVVLLAVLARIFVLLCATRPGSRPGAVLVDGTMFVYLGWVAVATVANVAAALQADGVDPLGLGADTWAVTVLALVAAVREHGRDRTGPARTAEAVRAGVPPGRSLFR